jgi:hypothetical protein
MRWPRRVALGLLPLTLPPGAGPAVDEPLPPGASQVGGPVAPTWSRRRTELSAMRVRLTHLGARTHANWVFFRLPFAVTETDRVRFVRFYPRVKAASDVGALRIGSVCLATPSRGGIDAWSLYTVNGIAGTEVFRWHSRPPTSDPTVVAVNVPTRVANYAACGADGRRLLDPEQWTLAVEWEQR